MTPAIAETSGESVVYPDSDGQPMADNTLQFEWITTIKGNLDLLYADRADVFVAGDHLIYAVEGQPTVRQAPDVYVAFGRPKGHRGSYKVWEEDGVFPQVVFKVLSPGNRKKEMARKFLFYQGHGAREYYVIDPDRGRMRGSVAGAAGLEDVPDMNGWVSPRLGIRFECGTDLNVYYPDGRRFLTFVELGQLQAETARRLEREQQQTSLARQRADRLAAKLRELGVDPDAP